ncbi:polysaccharide biosynthesis protein [Dokdonia sinensis]|uniref:polysaccharide biosynthesis protein n=1 Tax=Dokdonia sinensis TaxID=2479847 RepID=UPI001F45977C|nr:nucleoside-diphosphate sugar epimerase/dehydratase [Dokdonia sinensis]
MSIFITYVIIKELTSSFYPYFSATQRISTILVTHLVFFLVFKTYAGLIRHSSTVDAFKLMMATGFTFGFLIIGNYMFNAIVGEKIFLTIGLVLNTFVSFTLLYVFRLFVKRVYEYFKAASSGVKSMKAFILGLNENAISTASAMDLEHPKRFEVVGFLSKKTANKRLRVLDKPVVHYSDKFISKIQNANAEAVIFTADYLSFEEQYAIVEDCLNHDIKVFSIPPLQDLSEGESITKKIKRFQIEDLLNRNPIRLNDANKRNALTGKTILVTGGAGSIGSEIVRQVASYEPKQIIVLDQAETPLHNLSLELSVNFLDVPFEYFLCDVRNKERLKMLFETFDIDYIYHAAAYKHVPIVEDNPHEAILTNIMGTRNIADLAVAHKVPYFVMVSTDKAVNPTNVMGASKRVAELYVQSLFFAKADTIKTKFITTRFGNVLGSNGSVVPLFKKQIEQGGPITITHPDIIRYFMTIPEACQLVLEAGVMGAGGEIFVFDMGDPVKIKDLATRMIQLAGHTPGVDIRIEYTGLRPGEKLYEELLNDGSRVIPTHHHKIMISKDETQDFEIVSASINRMIACSISESKETVVSELKELVPNFKSNNSIFEALDKKLSIN